MQKEGADTETWLLIISSVITLEFLKNWFGLALTIVLLMVAVIKTIKEIQKWKDEKEKREQEKALLRKQNELLDIELREKRKAQNNQ